MYLALLLISNYCNISLILFKYLRMMLAVVQKEIEMELVTQKKKVVKEMVFKWEHALKDMGFAVLVSKLIAFCQ